MSFKSDKLVIVAILFLFMIFSVAASATNPNAEIMRSATKAPSTHSPNVPDPGVILQGGDTIDDATVISSLPFTTQGTNVGYSNDYEEVCPYDSDSPDVVYAYTPSQDGFMDIDLCVGVTDYDTKLFVYENDEFTLVGCNDDACSSPFFADYVSKLTSVPISAGQTYYIVVDGYDGDAGNYSIEINPGMEPLDACPSNTIFGQETHQPSDSWSAGTSDSGPAEAYLIYENFDNGGMITDIQFWGLDAYFSGGWSECWEDPMTFDVKFYEDDGGFPGDEVATRTVTINPTPTGLIFSGFELNQYNATFSSGVDLAAGWVSIQGVSDPTTCWFLWMSGYGNDGHCYQWDGSMMTDRFFDQAICLISLEPNDLDPPVNLIATSNQDSAVPLHWTAPGVLPCTTIAYDDGVLANAYYYYAADNLMASRFVATAPIEICTVFVHVLTQGDAYWPWPDGNHDPVTITVWEGDGAGYPGDMLGDETVTCELGEWITVAFDPPLVCNDDMFWVSMNNISDTGPYDGIGLDAFTDHPENKWVREGGVWSVWDLYSGDHMIRASVRFAGMGALLTENDPYGDPPVTLDLLGYNIYRDTSPGVPTDEDHLIDFAVSTSYDDEDVNNGTTYYYVVTALYDEGESWPSNEASATPGDPGELEVDPEALAIYSPAGDIATANLRLTNVGDVVVNFTIVATTEERLAGGEAPLPEGSVQAKPVTVYDKSQTLPEEQNPPMILDSGGPDAFGYKWIDSDEPNGPEFEWIDISGVGNYLAMSDDDNQGPFSIGFNFPFYGNMFNAIRICSNGWLSFTSTTTIYTNVSIPNSAEPNNLVAPWWDDMNASAGGAVYYYYDEDNAQFIVSYEGVPYWSGGGSSTFQVILYPDGKMKFQYDVMDPGTHGLNSATIGIEDAGGAIGLPIAFDQDYMHDQMAIMIKTGWLSTNPTSGTIPGDDYFDVEVICDASDLVDGHYIGMLTIHASDENHDLEDIEIPIDFYVQPTGIENGQVELPQMYMLNQNYPNPFNAKTGISFAIPKASDVELSVFNMLGQKVATLASGYKEAGFYQVEWDASKVASGIYYYKLTAGDYTETQRMTLLK